MLDRAEAFALGERDIVVGHVVLEIDEGLAARAVHVPQRRRSQCSSARHRARRRAGREAAVGRRLARRPRAVGQSTPPATNSPPAAPATVMPRGSVPGTKAAMRSLQTRPCRRDGRSGAASGSSRPTRRRDRSRSLVLRRLPSRTSTAAHARCRPCAASTAPPAISRAPAALAAAAMLPRHARADR